MAALPATAQPSPSKCLHPAIVPAHLSAMSSSLFQQPSISHALTRGVLGRRMAAFVLDCTLIGLFSFGFSLFILLFGFFTLGLGWLMFHLIPWVPLLYFTAFIGSEGVTPGQRAMGIAVRQAVDLAPPTGAQAFVWSLFMALSFCFGGLPFLLALFTQGHRAAHDMLSGLVIVRQPQIFY